jgi:hypothetical protein
MPCDIELANAQLKLWDYKLLESVHTPIYSPNSSDAVQAIDTSHTHISGWHPPATRRDWS